ncbi:DUF4190 domain-containing protein [Hamadaea tsunoensis]|uniref:DUF4190 domain-containing protein n=1 Tax=Hamadaea tsunoensis TaxID=53368 RepID=UPI0004068A58|nr:DUF4190 domain-containing protein [Hamadaea tsunoensis]
MTAPLPPAYAPAPPPAPRTTSGFAVAAVVCGLIGCNPLGILFAIIALVRIPKRNQKGKGLAITGLVLSLLWIFGILGGAVYAYLQDSGSAATAPPAGDGRVSVTRLVPGDCLSDVSEASSVTRVPRIACDQPHQGEVFAVFTVAFPGVDELDQQSEDGCQKRFSAYAAGSANLKMDLYYLHPTETSWAAGDRTVICIAADQSGSSTGSIKG